MAAAVPELAASACHFFHAAVAQVQRSLPSLFSPAARDVMDLPPNFGHELRHIEEGRVIVRSSEIPGSFLQPAPVGYSTIVAKSAIRSLPMASALDQSTSSIFATASRARSAADAGSV